MNFIPYIITATISIVTSVVIAIIMDRADFLSKKSTQKKISSQAPYMYIMRADDSSSQQETIKKSSLYDVSLHVNSQSNDTNSYEKSELLFYKLAKTDEYSYTNKYFLNITNSEYMACKFISFDYGKRTIPEYIGFSHIILDKNTSVTLIISAKDRPLSITMQYNEHTLVYDTFELTGNIIYPSKITKIKTPQ